MTNRAEQAEQLGTCAGFCEGYKVPHPKRLCTGDSWRPLAQKSTHTPGGGASVENTPAVPSRGEKRPINRSCSACGDGDTGMKYHDHYPPFADEPNAALSAANFVAEVHPRPDDPSCHICGALMVPKEFKCLSCGATSGVSPAPAGPDWAEQAAMKACEIFGACPDDQPCGSPIYDDTGYKVYGCCRPEGHELPHETLEDRYKQKYFAEKSMKRVARVAALLRSSVPQAAPDSEGFQFWQTKWYEQAHRAEAAERALREKEQEIADLKLLVSKLVTYARPVPYDLERWVKNVLKEKTAQDVQKNSQEARVQVLEKELDEHKHDDQFIAELEDDVTRLKARVQVLEARIAEALAMGFVTGPAVIELERLLASDGEKR